MNGESVLGELGTFDVENYGDLLYPVLFERMLRKRNQAWEVHKFSFIHTESMQGCGYITRPVQPLFSSNQERLRALVVGGGDLLRTDWNLVASHYRSIYLRRKGGFPLRDLPVLFARLLGKRVDFAAQFRSRHMNYPAVGPFIIDPAKLSNVKLVAYCSCGVPFPFGEDVRSQVANVINKSSFIYLRDRQSRDRLVEAGVQQEIHVGPDLIVALSDFFDPVVERERGRSILQKQGVDIRRHILCVQCRPQQKRDTLELAEQLRAYQERTACDVILIPIGRCHGDEDYLKELARTSCGAFKYIEIYSIFDILSVLAACNIFLGTSLHGNITAFSFGIPHLFAPIAVAKADGFLDVVNLARELRLKSWAEVNQKLDMVTSLDRDYFSARVSAAKRRVNEVFDLLLQAVAKE
jgi:polysaccharide pyruvyl transferase WcaK-like protein